MGLLRGSKYIQSSGRHVERVPSREVPGSKQETGEALEVLTEDAQDEQMRSVGQQEIDLFGVGKVACEDPGSTEGQ